MNCERFEKLIDSYLDGQLLGTLLAEFHAHRLNCRRCSRIVSMLQAAGDVIAHDLCEPKISADFADRVVAAMPAARKADRSVWLVRLTAGAAGLAAAAAITIAVLLSGRAHKTNVAGAQAIAAGSGIGVPPGAEVTHHGTLLDGKVVREAVDRVMYWDEVKLRAK
jgi:anti-sigma factor RsiW